MNESMSQIRKPSEGEYNPYFGKYINLVPAGDFFAELKKNTDETLRFFNDLPAEKHEYRYAEGKWTVKEVLLHLIDTERVFAYRALVAARGDYKTPLPPVDENLWAANADTSTRSMENLLEEFKIVRKSAEILFENMNESQSSFKGYGAGHPVSARALGYIMIGHFIHHMNVIKERYL